jgi:hypothetical protein
MRTSAPLVPPERLAAPQREAVQEAVADAFTGAYRCVMGAALLAMASAATAWFLLPRMPRPAGAEAGGEAPHAAG